MMETSNAKQNSQSCKKAVRLMSWEFHNKVIRQNHGTCNQWHALAVAALGENDGGNQHSTVCQNSKAAKISSHQKTERLFL